MVFRHAPIPRKGSGKQQQQQQQEASYQIEKEINHFLENEIKANFSLWMNHSVSTIGNLFRNKDKQALLHLTGTVDKFQCSC